MHTVDCAVALFLAIALLVPQGATAAGYPAQPIRLLIPNPPGGGSDTLARIVSPKLSDALGQPLVLDNRAGGGGTIATETAARASPDGYTLLLGFSAPLAVSPALVRTAYDPVRDFAPITLVAATQYLMVAQPAGPRTIKEFVAYAKSRPGRINYASAGNGTPSHLATELFKLSAGVDLVHVPYKGGGPAAVGILAGDVQLFVGAIPAVLPHVRTGKLVAFGVTGARRAPAAPDISTIAELGYPGFDVTSWYGVLAPARTPAPLIVRLNAEIRKVLGPSDVVDQLTRQGFDVIGSDPQYFGEYLRREVARWARVVKQAGIKAD